VGKIPVIKPGDGKHANHVKQERDDYRYPAPAYPDDSQTADMKDDERKNPQPVYPFFVNIGDLIETGFGIDPSKQGPVNQAGSGA